MPDRKWKHIAAELFCPLLLLLVGVALARLSWLKWPDPLVDFGRELYVPWRITEGDVLYRDINHFYGPLSHYLNAGLFSLLGVGLDTLVKANLALLATFTAGLYFSLSKPFGRLAATFTGLAFLTMFAFAQYVIIGNYNYVCPYSHELVHGLYLAAMLLLVLGKIEQTWKWYWYGMAGVLAGLICMTKIEVAVAAGAALGLFSVYVIKEQGRNRAWHFLPVCLSGWCLPLFCFWIYFSTEMSGLSALKAVFMSFYAPFSLTAVTHNVFYEGVSGMDAPAANFSQMLRILLAESLYAGLLLIGFTCLQRVRNVWLQRTVSGVAAILLTVLAAVYKTEIPWLELGKPLPLYLLIIVIYVTHRRYRGDRVASLTFIAAAVFSLIFLVKMILNVNIAHYGFAIAMPATLLFITLSLHWNNRLRWFIALSLCVVMANQVEASKSLYQYKSFQVGAGVDHFYAYCPEADRTGLTMQMALDEMTFLVPASATVVAFPEGVMLNYLLRKKNPAYFFEGTPPFIAGVGEERMIGYLQASKPDFVIITDKDTSEHGARFFGTDYAFSLWSWIMANYTEIETIGPKPLTGKGFGITIMKQI